MKNYNKYIKQAHETAKGKGFYDKDEFLEDRFGLIIFELWKSVVAFRKDKWTTEEDLAVFEAIGKFDFFENSIKGTVQYELSAATIRIFDLCGFLGVSIYCIPARCYVIGLSYISSIMDINSMILQLSDKVCANSNNENYNRWFSDIVFKIEALAKHYNIDLWTHIDMKMEYNKTSEYRHGKKI